MKHNERLQRVQVGREKELPLGDSSLWFLVIKDNGEWDSENDLEVFLKDIKKGVIKKIFCVWHGNWRTNLFLMEKKFILDYFKKVNKSRQKSKGVTK